MNRDIEKYLLKWKDSPVRQPLIIGGARQVWKTYAIRKFGREKFENYRSRPGNEVY
jgi:uncharacterized protein